ncbi:unnamed protein product [Xylocopa violacea]|uniref:PHD-type domain-containing protein n=1 Tax=Xylocopa violacea TaxID=135666 RepID=A0ABP1NTR7_XYLVO
MSEEDAKEERMEEEMTLTLESDEIESHLEGKSENEKNVAPPAEVVEKGQKDSVHNMDDVTDDLLTVEKLNNIETDKDEDNTNPHDAEDLMLVKNGEISDKQQFEDNDSKSDTNKDDLKNILDTASNVEEMFSEEQCQNTQDTETSILDNESSMRSATDFKNILNTETDVINDIDEVFEQSENLPLVEGEIDELTEKLPQDSEDILNRDMEETTLSQDIDSLEGLLGLDLMPEGEDSTLKSTKAEEESEKPEQLSKVVDMSILLEQSNHNSDIVQASDYITDVISSCLTDENAVPLESNTVKSDAIAVEVDKAEETEVANILKVDENIIPESMDKDENIDELQEDLREGTDLAENELDMDFEETPLESVDDLEDAELASDILLDNVDHCENMNDAPSGVETSQPGSEISELESAVKFLQESEEQAMDSPLELSPKMVESVTDDISKQAQQEITLERETEEKITVEKQTEEKDTVKRQIDQEIIVERQSETKSTVEEEAEKDITIEKHIEQEIMIETQAEEKITAERQSESKVSVVEQAEQESTVEEHDIVIEEQIKEEITDVRHPEGKIIVEKQIEEEEVEEKQFDEEEVMEKQIDEEEVVEKQIEEEEVMEKHINEEEVMEKQIEEEEVMEKQIEQDEVMEKQIEEEVMGKHINEDVVEKQIEEEEVEERQIEEEVEEKQIDEEVVEKQIDEEEVVRKQIDEEVVKKQIDEEVVEKQIEEEEIMENQIDKEEVVEKQIKEEEVEEKQFEEEEVEEKQFEQVEVMEKQIDEEVVEKQIEEEVEEKQIEEEEVVEKQIEEEKVMGKQVEEEEIEEKLIEEEEVKEKQIEEEEVKEKQLEEEEAMEKQLEEEEVMEKQFEEEEVMEKQIDEEEVMEKQIDEEEVMEKQIDEEELVEKQTEKEEVEKKQIEEEEVVGKQFEEEEIDEKQIEEEEVVEKQIEDVNMIEEQTTECNKESSSPKIVTEEEQPTEIQSDYDESICKLAKEINTQEDKESNPEQCKESVIQKEMDAKTQEPTNYANGEEDTVSDVKFIQDTFSPLDQQPIVMSEEDAKEEHMEEEMTLTLESDEIEAHLEEKSENEINVVLSEEIAEKDQKDSILNRDNEATDALTVEKLNTIETDGDKANTNTEDAEDSMLMKNEEISDRQEFEDNDSKSDNDNLKNILDTASNVEEMFSEEQCQNTQDIETSILDNESSIRSTTDFKNILSTEEEVVNDIDEVLQQSENLPLVEAEIGELTEKLPQDSEDILNKDMEDSTLSQNIDSLEGLLGLDLMPEGEDSTSKLTKAEEEVEKPEQLSKVVDILLEQSNHNSVIVQASDYITDVISSCLTDENTVPLESNTVKSDAIVADVDKADETEVADILKVDENILPEPLDKDENIEDLQKDLRESTDLAENELDMDFGETPLESVGDLEDTESKLELTSDILLDNVDQSENLNDAPSGVETSQPSSEISELESAVKFLQESEEQAMDSSLELSPKMVESVVDDISKQAAASSLFVHDEDICENTSELEAELQNITTDSISISEAEIISEAAKLESEKKLAEQIKIDALQDKFETDVDNETINNDVSKEKITVPENSETKLEVTAFENSEVQQEAPIIESRKTREPVVSLPQNVLKTSDPIPKVSILEERLKEPPKIEIPTTDITKVSMSPTTSKDNLLIQRDAKLMAYQRMLESPKLSDKSEPKLMDTPRKDSEKHDFENVGSPRIILKIAKSAITDCGEPRSPKSPKIRSATNSPNPEDSPGQKLGKIKLKLSKSGHPSIISNENIEEMGQWYTEGSSSLSPIGMKIKLSKTGDASIVSSEKHESIEDLKEGKHKHEEIKRTESPIGMKIKLSKSGDASIVQQDSKEIQMKHKDKLDMVQGSPKRTESPIGMKFKLSKTGDASIIQPERQDLQEEYKDSAQMKPKEKHEPSYDSPKRTDSPIGMKIKLSKTGDASIVSPDLPEESKEACKVKEKLESSPEVPKRTESPIGMKIKLTKTKGGASIISMENAEESREKLEVSDIPKRTESPLGMKIKLSKTGDASIVHSEVLDEIKEKVDLAQDTAKSLEPSCGMKIKVIKSGEISHVETVAPETKEESVEPVQESLPKVESPIGMKIKLSKFGDASIVPSDKQEQSEDTKLLQELPKRTESPLGMKIKLSKSGDASIIQPESSEDTSKTTRTGEVEYSKSTDASLGMKIKLLKTGDASIVDSEKKDRQQRRRDTESPLEMKIKLSKTGHPTIVACDNQAEVMYKPKEVTDPSQSFTQRYKETGQAGHKEPALKILKTGHSTILQSNRSELTIEPVQMQGKKPDNVVDISPKRKDITIAPIEAKKSKLEAQFTQMLPEVTIQPVATREQKQFLFDPKNSAISFQQMTVINQEISITQVRPQKPMDASMSEKLKDILSKNVSSPSINSDCEIIEHRPELIIVNENSNSSQDVVIIEEVAPNRMPEVKVPKKRGRPRRNPLPQGITHAPPHMLISRDPLSLDDTQQMQQPHYPESRENERPKRTCRSQKSYAPPKRGRGRGRGKRKLDIVDPQIAKKARIEQDLSAIEASTTAVITIDDSGMQQESFAKSSELYKVLKQPTMDSKITSLSDSTGMQTEINKMPDIRLPKPISIDLKDKKSASEIVSEKMQKLAAKVESENKFDKPSESAKSENKDMLIPPGHPNWLTPPSKKMMESATKHENVSTVQVIDEETRMSAESGSRSQTPARNISVPASETLVNEESQGSVLSTATTESEKVKVKNRRMEINFDPDEGPFTVDKIAEYEWPLDRKGETFMIQEQISQYLGVKSFKRKYPDLKRRVVDMEERNYLRENGLVSEAMCDMGLTAICSSEVLDVMCSDFPDQYEEYRKHMREKQVKEHSKKQKELTAAANAEKNRIDLAEMAVQSALSWNISLNKARRENRKCSLDLQTFTIHVPKKQQKVETERRIGNYPVALIPGQYTDYYREYTPAELRYYPLNTVLYGPMRPNERKFDSQSEGSQSDSDSDSSSDDSSEGTQDTEGSQSTMDEVDMEIANQKDEIKLKCKMCLKTLNKHSKNEVLIQCGTCNGHVHPSCIDLTLDMVPHIQSYAWQCTDCKTCAQCHDPADEDKMLFCDMCDRGYHIYCVGLRRVPQGRWHCQECAVCANCGSREPGGINSDRNSVAQWQHEYKKGDKNTRVYVSTLCVPCSKLRGDQGTIVRQEKLSV